MSHRDFVAQFVLLAGLWLGGYYVAPAFLFRGRTGGRNARLAAAVVLVVAWPAGEEAIFRAPICLGFAAPSPGAWFAVALTTILFAALHSVEQPPDRLLHARGGRINLLTLRVSLALLLGVLTGTCALYFHSLLLCFAIHATWNLVILALIARPKFPYRPGESQHVGPAVAVPLPHCAPRPVDTLRMSLEITAAAAFGMLIQWEGHSRLAPQSLAEALRDLGVIFCIVWLALALAPWERLLRRDSIHMAIERAARRARLERFRRMFSRGKNPPAPPFGTLS